MTASEALAAWHDFYLTTGAAAATLAGLLFVGLSLHIQVAVAHSEVRSLARVTLTNFVAVLLISLTMLVPAADASVASVSLIVMAAMSFALLVRPAMDGFRAQRVRPLGLLILLARFGLSAACHAGAAAAGTLFGVGRDPQALYVLLGVVVLLLVVAIRNTWDLLVTVALEVHTA